MSQYQMHRLHPLLVVSLSLIIAALTFTLVGAQAKTVSFDMALSTAGEAAGCLPYGSGHVTVTEKGPVEVMDVTVSGLAPSTTYSLFVLQVPDKPFGVSWYNGEIETDSSGNGSQQFIARFNNETFAIAPGTAPAPVVHDGTPTPDASENPAFNPIHTFHLGLWFSDPADAEKAGCTNAVTPFDGDHQAGIQILSTRNYPPDKGPLIQVAP